jgi:hypothetical protein
MTEIMVASPSNRPDDPTSFEGLPRAGVITPPGWAAYQRDSLSDEDRDFWDARVKAVGGDIIEDTKESAGLRPGRMVVQRYTFSYYIVAELPEDAP